MKWAFLVIGAIVGAVVVFALMGGTTGQDIDQDKLCAERFGDNWTSVDMERNISNQSVKLTCTNGSATEDIGVSVDAEVDL